MERKYSIITGFLGKLKDRFIDYQPPRDMDEMIEMAAKVNKCRGLEVVYPQNFDDAGKLKTLMDKYKLETAAVNLNIKGEERWRYGTFSSPDKQTRRDAVAMLKNAMDASVELGCNLVQTALLNDGADYPFELDFTRAYEDTLEGIRECAEYRKDVRISLEYKASEPRVHCLFNNAGKMSAFCDKIGLPNVGVTLDTGHALQALETPADSVAFLNITNRLFYIHVNDNYRNWDWDMVPGTVNLWDFIEFFYYLKKSGYNHYITADVFPQRHDPIRIFNKTFEWVDYLLDITDKIDDVYLTKMMNEKDTFAISDYIRSLL